MGELRDLTEVFRAFQTSLRDIGNHVASQDANVEQLRLGLHDLRNKLAAKLMIDDEQEKSLYEINQWMGKFSAGQDAINERIVSLQTSLQDHRREINNRIKYLESAEEITQS